MALDPAARFEWLEVPARASRSVLLRPVDAAAGCTRCRACGWLVRGNDASCENCGAPSVAINDSLERLEVPAPEVEVSSANPLLESARVPPAVLARRVRALAGVHSAVALSGLRCESELEIALHPHQRALALEVLDALRGRALLADARGVGASVSAGVVARELLARGAAHSVLVLVPRDAIAVWREQVGRKVGLRAVLAGRKGAAATAPCVICSVPRAVRRQTSSLLLARRWDVLIVVDDRSDASASARARVAELVGAIAPKFLLVRAPEVDKGPARALRTWLDVVRPERPRRGPLAGSSVNGSGVRVHGGTLVRSIETAAPLLAPWSLSRRLFAPAEVEVELLRRASDARPPGAAAAPFLQLAGALPWLRLALACPAALVAAVDRICATGRAARGADAWRGLAEHASLCGEGARLEALRAVLREIDAPVLVCASTADVARVVAAALAADAERVRLHDATSSGGVRRASRAALRRGEARVLVSDDASLRALDASVCGTLVHYDVPWDPCVVARRHAAVRRLGRRDPVTFIALLARDTADVRAFDALQAGAGAFELDEAWMARAFGDAGARAVARIARAVRNGSPRAWDALHVALARARRASRPR